MSGCVAGIDVHKRVLVVVAGTVSPDREPIQFQGRQFGTTLSELRHLVAWLQQRGVERVVMESTAQYWKPVWLELEKHFRLSLAQAWSNRAPRGKKTDFKDAQRLVRRYVAGELTLSFVPEIEQRQMRTLTRRRTQLVRVRVRIQNQVESLLEETQVKLSSMVSDLFGASGVRMLTALAEGESDPVALAALADARVQRTRAELADAMSGVVRPIYRKLLQQHLAQLRLVDQQIEELTEWAAQAMQPYEAAVKRLCQIPGIRVVAAQAILAEVGAQAQAFPSSAQFSGWVGTCPGSNQSAGENHSSASPKGNSYLRRALCQSAQAASRAKNSIFEKKLNRLLPRLGYAQAIWAVARHLGVVVWIILHNGAEYIEYGGATTEQAAKRRVQRLKKELRALGYSDQLTPLQPEAAVG